MTEFLLHKLKFREQPPRFVDANPDTAVTTQVHEGIIECANLEKVSPTYIILTSGSISILLPSQVPRSNLGLCKLNRRSPTNRPSSNKPTTPRPITPLSINPKTTSPIPRTLQILAKINPNSNRHRSSRSRHLQRPTCSPLPSPTYNRYIHPPIRENGTWYQRRSFVTIMFPRRT